MAEEIGSLAVSMSMDASNFNGTISQVNRQMKAMGGELQAIRAKGKDFEDSIEGMTQKQDVLQRSFDAAGIKLREQRQRYDDLVASGTATEAQLERQAIAVNQAQAQYNRFNRELNEVTQALNDATDKWKQAGASISEFGERASDTGGKLKDIGGTLTASLTAPILALGTGAIMAAAQFDNAAGQIQAALGVTADEAEALKDKATNVWKAGFGESLEEVSAGLIRVKQNMKEIDGSEIESVTKNALALAKSFESDVNEVTRAANNLMVNFGISSQEAFDLLAYGAQNGLNFSNELFDNVAEYSGLFKTLGFTAEEYFQTLEKGAQQGVYNLDYLNDVIKEFGIRIKDGSDATSDALAQVFAPDNIEEFTNALFKNGKKTEEYLTLVSKVGEATASELVKNLQKGGKSMEDSMVALQIIMGDYDEFMDGMADGSLRGADAMQMIIEKIQSFEDQSTRAQLGVALFGTKWEDLEEMAMFALTGIDGELGNVEGSMKSVTEAQAQTFGQRWESLTRTAATSLEPLGMVLIDLAEDWLPKIAGALESAARWFDELSPSAQNTTLAIGGIAAVAGPVIAGVGLIASGIGSIAGVIGPVVASLSGFGAAAGTAGAGAGIFGGAIAALSGPVGWAAIGIAAIGTASLILVDQLSESSIQVEDWSGKVSEATAEAVGSFMDLSNEAASHLNTLSLTGQAVTQEMATNIISVFSQMGEQVLAEMQADHEEQLSAITNFYANSNVLIESEEAEILARTAEYQTNKEKQISDGNARIAEIMKTASNEKRELTLAEEAEINHIHATMKDNAIKYMTESELEQRVIYEAIKNNASEISALQAAEVVKNAIQQKEDVVAEAEEQYKKAVAEIIKQRDEMGVISGEQSRQLIEDAAKQRDETIKAAEEMHQKVVTEAQEQAGEHVAQVDWETGEVKAKWEVMKDTVSDYMKELGANIKSDWEQAWTDTKTSVSNIYDSATEKFNEMKTSIETKMGEAKTKIETKWAEAQAFLEGINLADVGRDIVAGLVKGIQNKFADVTTTMQELGSSVISSISSVLQRKSPARKLIEVGEDVGEGLAIGIERKQSRVEGSMIAIGESLLKINDDYAKEILKREAKLSEDLSKANEKTYNAVLKIKKNAAKEKRSVTVWEKGEIKKLEDAYQAEKLSLEKKASEDIAKVDADNIKNRLNAVKAFIDNKKAMDEISLVDEANIWYQSIDLFAEGTNERLSAQQNYKASVETLQKEIVSINDYYTNEMQRVNETLIANENNANQQYASALESRRQSLYNFASIFDEITIKADVSGQQLLANLASQVVAMEDWAASMQSLAVRGIDEGLVAELQAMGPKAIAEIQALNTLTNQELEAYNELWKQKSALAVEQATKELEPMKAETERNIAEMRDAASKELDQLQADWASKIEGLTSATESSLASLESIGADAGNKLLSGLSSMEGPLVAKAQAIGSSIAAAISAAVKAGESAAADATKTLTNAVKKTTKKEMDINSPSAEMAKLGGYVADGYAVGIVEGVSKVRLAASSLTQAIKDTVRYDMYNPKDTSSSSSSSSSSEDPMKVKLDAEKEFIAERKRLNLLSLADELAAYEQFIQDYGQATDGYIYYEKQIQATKKAIHDELISLNNTYVNKINATNTDFAKQELAIQKNLADKTKSITAKLNQDELNLLKSYNDKVNQYKRQQYDKELALIDSYQNELASRTKQKYNEFGLFDQAKVGKIAGSRLTLNLESQLKAMEEWQSNMLTLEGRGVDNELIKELQDMGMNAAGEVKALNRMSDSELSKYVELWRKKSSLAKKQATHEMEDMKIETDRLISELRSETANNLDLYEKEWQDSLSSLTTNAAKELQVLNDDAQGKLEELRAETQVQLDLYQTEWVSAISKVKDGSKDEFNAMLNEMPEIGGNVIAGLRDGLSGAAPGLFAQVQSIADQVRETISSALNFASSSAASALTSATAQAQQVVAASTSIDNSRTFSPNVKIYTQSSGASEMERTLTRMQYGLT